MEPYIKHWIPWIRRKTRMHHLKTQNKTQTTQSNAFHYFRYRFALFLKHKHQSGWTRNDCFMFCFDWLDFIRFFVFAHETFDFAFILENSYWLSRFDCVFIFLDTLSILFSLSWQNYANLVLFLVCFVDVSDSRIYIHFLVIELYFDRFPAKCPWNQRNCPKS